MVKCFTLNTNVCVGDKVKMTCGHLEECRIVSKRQRTRESRNAVAEPWTGYGSVSAFKRSGSQVKGNGLRIPGNGVGRMPLHTHGKDLIIFDVDFVFSSVISFYVLSFCFVWCFFTEMELGACA